MEKVLTVEGMTCMHCVMAVKNAVGALTGVKKVDVDLETKKVNIEGEGLKDNLITEAIEEAGYEVVEIK
ncbi:MAG: copper ion binding protein [Tissierellaceae bacterium]|nr:copper ion binding protein [Tissierellaceae bacterium]